jgi:hypothetical protein
MNTSFQFQMPTGFAGFVNDNLQFLLALFAIGAVLAFAYKASEARRSLKRLRHALALMFKQSSGGE